MKNITYEDIERAAKVLEILYEKSKKMLGVIPVEVQKEMLENGFTIDDFIREYKKYSRYTEETDLLHEDLKK